LIRVEFGSIPVLDKVSESHCSLGVASGCEHQVSSCQQGSVPFGEFAFSDIDDGGIGEFPQDALGHAGRKSICVIARFFLEEHGKSIDLHGSKSVDINESCLAFTIITECDTARTRENAIFVGFDVLVWVDVEDLDLVLVATEITGPFALVGNDSSRGHGLPVLRLLDKDVLHLFVARHVVVGILSDIDSCFSSSGVADIALVHNVKFHGINLVEDQNIDAAGRKIPSNNDTVAAGVGEDVGSLDLPSTRRDFRGPP